MLSKTSSNYIVSWNQRLMKACDLVVSVQTLVPVIELLVKKFVTTLIPISVHQSLDQIDFPHTSGLKT
jgi:hypothetical protein